MERGVALTVAHFDSIWRVSPWLWEVPSCSWPRRYTVNVKTGECSCPDRPPEGEECKHTVAARYVKARTFTCDGCAERTRYRDGVEVGDDNLTFFCGMWVCEPCAHQHGVL